MPLRAGTPTSVSERVFLLKSLLRADAFVGRYMPFFVISSVLLGFLFPEPFAFLEHLTIGLFAFMTFANSLGGGFRDLWRVFHQPLPVVTVLVLLHIVMPLIALGLGNLLFPDAPLFTIGLVLEYAIPTAVASLIWTGMGGGNTTLCLSLVLLDTICAPVVIPVTMQVLVGSVVEMDTASMMRDMLLMIALPALAAMTLYDTTHGRVAVTLKPKLSLFGKAALMLVIISNATGCAPFLRNLNGTLVLVMAAVFFLCLLGFFLAYWCGRFLKLDFPTIETMSLTGGMRNISAGAVLAQTYFPPDVLFPVAFSPIFLQATTALVVKVLQNTRPGKAHFAALAASQTDGHA